MAVDFQAGNFRDLECAQFQFFRDRPARDKANAESDFHGGFDGFSGIEIHHVLEQLEMQAGFFQSDLDDTARSGTLFAHQKIGGQQLGARHLIGHERRGHDQHQFILHEGFGANAAVAGGAFDKADRKLVVEEEMDDLIGIAAVQRELHARMFGEEGSEQTRENVLSNRGRDAER